VDAVVLLVDKESKKITLGVKQLSHNPWESIEKTIPVGSRVKGKVTKITAFGAFVELENGIEGLIHVTELSDQAFGKVEDVVSKGDEVTAKVIKVDPEHKKIALSIKEYLIDQNQVNRDDIVVTTQKRKKKEEQKDKSKKGDKENKKENEAEESKDSGA
jgi:small subunit ribosomal protein S1